MTPRQIQIDEFTKGMWKTFNSPEARAMRWIAGMSDQQAKTEINKQRKKAELPELKGEVE